MFKVIGFVILVAGMSVAPSLAQEVTGSLHGRILTSGNQPLSEVNIEVSSSSLQGTSGTASDAKGYFRFPALPVGTYTVDISHIAYQNQRFEDIRIRLGRTSWLGEIVLQPQTIEMSKVTVTDVRPQIDVTTAAIGANISRESIEGLPVDRDFRSVTALLPQANVSYLGDEVNISGATGLENAYFIDGINVTDPHRNMTSSDLPYNFIKDIEIKTGGYEAEFKSALGGIINVVTHSGGNEFHGQAFGFFTNNHLAGDRRLSPSEASIGDFSKSDVGFSLGGPFIRDKLWFYVAYNPNFEIEDVEIPGFGFRQDKLTKHVFAGKFTWGARDKTRLVFAVQGDPALHTRIGPSNDGLPTPSSVENIDPFLGKWDAGGVNLSLRATQILSRDALLEASITRLNREDKNLAATERGSRDSLFIDIPQATWSGGYGTFLDNHSTRTSGKATVSLFLGTHTVKAGLEYEQSVLNRRDWSADLIFKQDETTYLTIVNEWTGVVKTRVPSVFLQDSWLVSERLRLNLGLRWDGLSIIGSNGKTAQTIDDQFQPRAGFVFQPGDVGSQKVFGSYGRFYQSLPLMFAARFMPEYEEVVVFDHDPRLDPTGGAATPASGTLPISEEVSGLEGQYNDEFVLGYERQLSNRFKLGIRGTYRKLGQAVDDGRLPEGNFVHGNPGKGNLAFLPQFRRKYTAIELTLDREGRDYHFLLSYVLSRNHGNYAGLYNSETDLGPIPNFSRSLDLPEQVPNSSGLLPNDRTHSLKLHSSYRLNEDLTVGTSFSMQSGTPLTEYGGTSFGVPSYSFLTERGGLGRTPTIWDLNLRLTYSLPRTTHTKFQSRLILDVLHVGSARKSVDIDQIHYTGIDLMNGNQIGENPNYLQAKAFQPPMTVRLGLEVGF